VRQESLKTAAAEEEKRARGVNKRAAEHKANDLRRSDSDELVRQAAQASLISLQKDTERRASMDAEELACVQMALLESASSSSSSNASYSRSKRARETDLLRDSKKARMR